VDAGSSPACEAAAESLAAKLGGAGASCTVAVRLSASSSAVLGYALFCGSYATLDEAQARERAKTDTGFDDACSSQPSLTGSAPNDEFVFFKETSYAACACCGDGWVTSVSARNGLSVFGGSVLAAGPPIGKGYPTTWAPASDLASGCGSSAPLPAARGFDFASVSSQGATLDEATIQSALSAVWSTALPNALVKKQYIFDAVVLRHLGSGQDNGFPELIVLVNSGWLE